MGERRTVQTRVGIEALREALAPGHALGGINPDAEQLRALIEADRAGPLHFLNLLSFHPEARYPDGHEMAARKLSGREAYNGLYGPVAFRHVSQRGGRLTVLADVEQCLIGAGGPWHQVATMEYPDTAAFLDMVADPDYQAGIIHRDAGLADTVVLVTRPLLVPDGP